MRRRRSRHSFAGGAAVVLAVLGVFAVSVGAAPARADRPFQSRFTANANGDIAIVGNTLETCPDAAPGCADARAGRGSLLDDNDFAMRHVDVDHDPATPDSSTARLALPAGATVLFAALYDGARTDPGTRGSRPADSSPAALGTVAIRGPRQTGYTRLTAADGTLDLSSDVRGAYQAVHDVTALVRREGSGDYTVADVPAATGLDRYAGWSLIVAYEAPGQPPRNLTVFDGLQSVTRGHPGLSIPIAGFQTPLTGPVRTRLGFVAYEGDLGSTGDGVALDGQPLSDAASPVANFFDSAISVDGVSTADRSPEYRNQLGFDAKLVGADGLLATGSSSATIALRTTLEQYLPGAVSFATDLYAPDVVATKSVQNLTDPARREARAGDRLRYTVALRNVGAEAAGDVVLADELPAGVAFLPGSLRVDGADPVAQSDLAGDDLGEYDAATRTVHVRLGTGATPVHGGTLAVTPDPDGTATATFEAEVEPASTARTLDNVARVGYRGRTLDRPLSAISEPARIDVAPSAAPPQADVSVSEDETEAPTAHGGQVLDAVTVVNHGPDDATGVHVAVQAPAGATVEAADTAAGHCQVTAGTRVECELERLEAGAGAQIDLTEHVPAADERTGAVNEVTAAGDQLDMRVADNDARATAPAPARRSEPAADLRVDVRGDRRAVAPGGAVTETIALRDGGPGPATSVSLDAALDRPARRLDIHARGLRCRADEALHCTAVRLGAGQTARVRVTVSPRDVGRLVEAVSAGSDRPDPRPADNRAQLVTTVTRPALALRERIAPAAVFPGGSVQAQLTVRDTSAVPAGHGVVCASLPPGLVVRAAPGADLAPGRACWTLATLAAHGSRRLDALLEVSTRANPGGELIVGARGDADGARTARAQATVAVRARRGRCSAPAVRLRVGGPPVARTAC